MRSIPGEGEPLALICRNVLKAARMKTASGTVCFRGPFSPIAGPCRIREIMVTFPHDDVVHHASELS